MRLAPVAFAVAAVVAALTSAAASAQAPAAPGLAAQLRYVGRDPATGMPEEIAERAIFEIAQGYESYNEATQQPAPPPAVEGLDIARLLVPALGLDAQVARYGLDAAGRLDVPQDPVTVGWQPAYSALPGEGGPTFLAAHYRYGGSDGVFFALSTLAPGAEVAVVLSDGSQHRYRVTSVQDYLLESIDMGAILQGREGRENLTLMTCSGPFDGQTHASRTVVLAERVAGGS